MCVTAAAHLLWRPIVIITDSAHEDSGVIKVTPPSELAPETWGTPIHVAYYLDRHYEATEAVQPCGVGGGVKRDNEGVGGEDRGSSKVMKLEFCSA